MRWPAAAARGRAASSVVAWRAAQRDPSGPPAGAAAAGRNRREALVAPGRPVRSAGRNCLAVRAPCRARGRSAGRRAGRRPVLAADRARRRRTAAAARGGWRSPGFRRRPRAGPSRPARRSPTAGQCRQARRVRQAAQNHRGLAAGWCRRTLPSSGLARSGHAPGGRAESYFTTSWPRRSRPRAPGRARRADAGLASMVASCGHAW